MTSVYREAATPEPEPPVQRNACKDCKHLRYNIPEIERRPRCFAPDCEVYFDPVLGNVVIFQECEFKNKDGLCVEFSSKKKEKVESPVTPAASKQPDAHFLYFLRGAFIVFCAAVFSLLVALVVSR